MGGDVGRLPEFSGLRPRVRLHPPFHHLQRTRRQLGLDRWRLRPVALDGAAFRRRNGPVSGPETKGVACGARRGDELQEPGVGVRHGGMGGPERAGPRRADRHLRRACLSRPARGAQRGLRRKAAPHPRRSPGREKTDSRRGRVQVLGAGGFAAEKPSTTVGSPGIPSPKARTATCSATTISTGWICRCWRWR